jgi:hypothetical protein
MAKYLGYLGAVADDFSPAVVYSQIETAQVGYRLRAHQRFWFGNFYILEVLALASLFYTKKLGFSKPVFLSAVGYRYL